MQRFTGRAAYYGGILHYQLTPEAHLALVKVSNGVPARHLVLNVRIKLIAALLLLWRGESHFKFSAPKSAAKRRAERNRK